jgi:hypothetical protein
MVEAKVGEEKVGEKKVEATKARETGHAKGARGNRAKEGTEGKEKGSRRSVGARVAMIPIEVDKARQAFEELRGEFIMVRAVERVQRKIDMQQGAAVAHSVALRDAAPERWALFERLARAGLYDVSQIPRLGKLALAAWFVRYMLELGQFRASSARVSEEVVRQAQLVRARMVRVIDYWLGNVAEVAQRIEFVRTGSGHHDLASDLQELARLYERDDLRAATRPGVPHYHETDGHDARALAVTIFTGLGRRGESELERWSTLTERAWTLLARAYDEHRAKGIFLFSSHEDVTITYPSLTSAVRRAPARRLSPERPADEGGTGEEPPGTPPALPGVPQFLSDRLSTRTR